ncbi:MAG: class I SAM-dependent methyltransferase [Candidatus Baltobacteraceae bacterium]
MTAAGYSGELYDAIAAYGLQRGAAILDVGCGDGAASGPFADNDFPVTGVDVSREALAAARVRLPDAALTEAQAEALPFPDQRFDVAICAQSIHLFDRTRALQEMQRVLKPSGIVAVWWKQLMTQEGVREVREETYRERSAEPPPEGLTGGFKEFYAAAELRDQSLRVIPWRTSVTLEQFVLGESEEVRDALRDAMRRRLGAQNPALGLAYIQYLYLAKRR